MSFADDRLTHIIHLIRAMATRASATQASLLRPAVAPALRATASCQSAEAFRQFGSWPTFLSDFGRFVAGELPQSANTGLDWQLAVALQPAEKAGPSEATRLR